MFRGICHLHLHVPLCEEEAMKEVEEKRKGEERVQKGETNTRK
jgi:hypothetical protein